MAITMRPAGEKRERRKKNSVIFKNRGFMGGKNKEENMVHLEGFWKIHCLFKI